jgi:hypothetical protein
VLGAVPLMRGISMIESPASVSGRLFDGLRTEPQFKDPDGEPMKQKGRQRLDSTHVLGLVERMGTLGCVRESLRLALEELAGEAGEAPTA